ncbi:MAG: hypothetical protein JRD89_02460 [Deltaproteobacteria bacterium]|nr:hypothetical protein [Deltaproteobacteria bacterium]
MTQSTIVAPAAGAEPPQTLDEARLKLRHDIEQEIVRLAREPNPTPQHLNQIIINTVMSFIKELVELDVYDHRTMLGIAGDLDRRMNDVEAVAFDDEGEGDGVSDELANKVTLCISELLVPAEEKLESLTNAEARKALEQTIARSNEVIEQFTIEPDDEASEPSEAAEPAEG